MIGQTQTETTHNGTLDTPAGPPVGEEQFASPTSRKPEYTDGRTPGEWESKYPKDAQKHMRFEAITLASFLILFCILSGLLLSVSDQSIQINLHFFVEWMIGWNNSSSIVLHINFRFLMIFSAGCLGGTTFSIKWLVHAVAKCKWHVDRRYWRLFVPLIGGVYACVVITLFDGGIMANQHSGQPHSIAITAAFAFLVGYFSDGVSGLLSNIANAAFGTLEKK